MTNTEKWQGQNTFYKLDYLTMYMRDYLNWESSSFPPKNQASNAGS